MKGFSLVELLVALAIFTIFIGSVALLASDSYRASRNAQMRVRAISYIRETINAVVLSKDNSWLSIVDASDGSPKHITFSAGKYSFEEGGYEQDGITISITFNPVFRDANGNIVESGGTEDGHSRQVLVNCSWQDVFGAPVSMNSAFYINDWNTAKWVDTTEADFIQGTNSSTLITNNVDGEVQLEAILYADWCNPSWSLSSSDLPGQGIAQTIHAIDPGEVFAGTGENASGLSFFDIVLDDSDPPVVTVTGTLDGYKTNNVFGEDDFGYITTDTNAKEVVIIDLLVDPIVEIGYFDAPGSADGRSVVVSGDYGYLASDDGNLYVFDLASRVGERLLVGAPIPLAGIGYNMRVQGNYLYVATGDTTTQLQIIDITNPLNPSIVGQALLSGEEGVDLDVNEDETRVYVATGTSDTQPEIFIIDITEKTGDRPTIATYDTNGMDPLGIIVVPDQRAIVVGNGGEEYQVVDIEVEGTPVYCGGLEYNFAIYDISTATHADGSVYSYVVTDESSNEFKMIRGGAGGGGGAGGQGYSASGEYISRVFDTNSVETYYYYIEWSETLPVGTNIQVQIRTGDAPDLSAIAWVGPDGTSATYFTEPNGSSLPALLNNHRYVQYRVLFDSDTIETPVLEEIKVSYQ